MLLSSEHLSKNFGMKQLLNDVSLHLNEGDRMGIVGLNGSGKSTLLKIFAGLEPPDEGVVNFGQNIKTVYLPQNPVTRDDSTVLEQVFEDVSSAAHELAEFEAKAMLNRLGISDFTAKMATLSGGQRKRVALAAALLHPSDILLLDEPTNHLDSEMVSWLEQYLSRIHCGLIMVTHDRYFLERVTNRITELSRGKLYFYEANYSSYLELKAQRIEMDSASERKRQATLRKESQWIMRGARARGTKSRERIDRYEALRDQAGPEGNDSVQLATLSSRLGRKIIELTDVSKAFEERVVIDHFSYLFSRDDRVGVLGRNGAGKSTLLNIIAGKLAPDSGELDAGITVKIGYFEQECCALDFDQRVFDFISGISREIKTLEGTFTASQMLERFLFGADLQYTTIGRLSGGERRRLYLLSILMEAPNILLLDEPTNDLDIETLTILEEYLKLFPGAVMAVSHDRYFLDKISTSIFEVEEKGKISCYTGNYSDYAERRLAMQPLADTKKLISKSPPPPSKDITVQKTRTLKFSYREQQDFDAIDDRIAELEAQLKGCLSEIGLAASDYVRLQKLMEQKEALEAALESQTERWIYLNELADQIQAQQRNIALPQKEITT